MKHWTRKLMVVLIVGVTAQTATAAVQARYVYSSFTTFKLEAVEKDLYQATQAEFEGLEAYRLTSEAEKVGLLYHNEVNTTGESLIDLSGTWRVKDHQVSAVSRQENWVAFEELENDLREDMATSLTRKLYDFVVAELPQLKLSKERPRVRVGEFEIRCQEIRDLPNQLICTALVEGEINLETEQFEIFRGLGLDPVKVMRQPPIEI